MEFYLIYKTTNLLNNKIYIGSHRTDNIEDDYLGSGTLLKQAIKKIKEIYREMTAKTGQKCTAVRRILVPKNKIDQVQKALITKLENTVIGNPENKDVKMGALASKIQHASILPDVKHSDHCPIVLLLNS